MRLAGVGLDQLHALQQLAQIFERGRGQGLHGLRPRLTTATGKRDDKVG